MNDKPTRPDPAEEIRRNIRQLRAQGMSEARGNEMLSYLDQLTPKPPDAIDRQNIEFEAVTYLAKRWAQLQVVAIVDDDYPEARFKYEGAISGLINAFKINNRIPS